MNYIPYQSSYFFFALCIQRSNLFLAIQVLVGGIFLFLTLKFSSQMEFQSKLVIIQIHIRYTCLKQNFKYIVMLCLFRTQCKYHTVVCWVQTCGTTKGVWFSSFWCVNLRIDENTQLKQKKKKDEIHNWNKKKKRWNTQLNLL